MVAKPLTPEQQQLVLDHVGIAKFCLNMKRNLHLVRRIGNDDAKQEAMVGLCLAARTYDPSRGAKFTTWASTVIHSRLVNTATYRSSVVRSNEFKVYGVPAGATVSTFDEWCKESLQRDGEPTFDLAAIQLDLEEALKLAKPQEKQDIAMLLSGLSFTEIGRLRGVSKQAVNLGVNKFIRRARAMFQREAAA